MKSLRELLILGPGPSSSHTIGPYRICKSFQKEHGTAFSSYEVTLFGSLSKTGKGHFTDRIVEEALGKERTTVVFSKDESHPHPNTMAVKGVREDGTSVEETYVSIGGGAYRKEGEGYLPRDIYPFSTFDGMKAYLAKNEIDDIETVIERIEGKEILPYGEGLLRHSFETIEEGLSLYDVLPGPLRLHSVASKIYEKAVREENRDDRRLLLLAAYSYATAEENARGKAVVTAPTCGASGVVPAVLYLCKETGNFALSELVRAYLVGALVCNFIKENAAISGAVYGCQAEIGSACSFAAAALCALHHLPVHQIEYAAEVAMEHFLGLTCDPVEGCVQIPCIERNAMASIHAYSSFLFSKDIAPLRHNRVSFDNVVRAMKETGKALPKSLKETAQGGLAKIIHYC